jgi:hypothetical protein
MLLPEEDAVEWIGEMIADEDSRKEIEDGRGSGDLVSATANTERSGGAR